MARIYEDAIGGDLDSDHTDSTTTLTSAALTDMQAVASPDTMIAIIDPDGLAGAPEHVEVTTHTAAAGTATVTRGVNGTTARSHLAGTPWVHGLVADEAERGSTIWVPAESFWLGSGSPAETTAGGTRYSAWAFDSGTDERIHATTLLPAQWGEVTCRLFWTNLGAGSGDVVWDFAATDALDGATLAADDYTDTANTVTAPAQDVVKVTEFLTAQSVNSAGIFSLRITRDADNGSDTLANDAGVLGVLIEGRA